jgi:small-conductance mechanosensitive channel
LSDLVFFLKNRLAKLLLAAFLAPTAVALGQVEPALPRPTTAVPSAEKKTDDATPKDASVGEKAKSAEAKAEARKPDAVRDTLDRVRSWSLPGFIAWLQRHGIAVAGIVLVSACILWVANGLHKRLVRLLAGATSRASAYEQENRARTLVGVLHNALRTTVIAIATIMVLDEVGLPIGPLLGGVAVVGLAVAFGAQSLIKDYFTGFLVLLEQQYMIGDVIKIGGVTGQVEQISLRLTVLRDLEGAVHFVPHGQITLVSNLTHGWSQAVFDLNVATSEHVERVREIFFELAKEVREDAKFSGMVLNDAEMLGVESLGDNTFLVKFAIKTLPLKRWEIKREILRRIKDRFQQLSIKITIPA